VSLSFLNFQLIFLNMRYVPRSIESEILRAVRSFPAVILTGPRRAGKTTLLQTDQE
jgi:predicted AAA+ superfamily ATPase